MGSVVEVVGFLGALAIQNTDVDCRERSPAMMNLEDLNLKYKLAPCVLHGVEGARARVRPRMVLRVPNQDHEYTVSVWVYEGMRSPALDWLSVSKRC
jgi:hypothetical protein